MLFKRFWFKFVLIGYWSAASLHSTTRFWPIPCDCSQANFRWNKRSLQAIFHRQVTKQPGPSAGRKEFQASVGVSSTPKGLDEIWCNHEVQFGSIPIWNLNSSHHKKTDGLNIIFYVPNLGIISHLFSKRSVKYWSRSQFLKPHFFCQFNVWQVANHQVDLKALVAERILTAQPLGELTVG